MFSPASSLGEIVARHPAFAAVFERLELDYCCGGTKSLAAACQARGLNAAYVITQLDAAAEVPLQQTVPDPSALTLTALADHIEQTHHVYVKRELPALLAQSRRLAVVHGGRDSRHAEVSVTVAALADEMILHIVKEEQILFPLIRQLDRGNGSGHHCGTMANPIRVMELEHDNACGAVHHLRKLTRGFAPDADACEAQRALLAGLARFEQDLHGHVHKENNILFPRAIEREASLAARGP